MGLHNRVAASLITAVLVLAFLALTGTIRADIYSWIEPDGVPIFSNVTPPESPGRVATLKENSSLQDGSQGLALDRFKVTAVYDGDTVKVTSNRLTVIVRLVGIDSPETGGKAFPGQPFSQAATRMLRQRVLDTEVALRWYGTGGYNRMLGELFLGTTNVNLELVNAGLAEVYSGPPPKGLDLEPYFRAQARAKRLGLGIWSLGNRYESPRKWRLRNPRKE